MTTIAADPVVGGAQLTGRTAHDDKERTMCRPVACETCGKTTWAGCGEHIDSVKEHVAPEQWCDGHAA